MKRDRRHSIIMSHIVLDQLVRADVPHVDLPVRAAGDDAVAVVVEEDLAHSAG